MKQLNNFILEKLKITKDSKSNNKSSQYRIMYGNGEIKLFKDCNIYKVEKYGSKKSSLEYDDDSLKQLIDKYFDDNDKIWLVTETEKIDSNMSAKIALDINKIKSIFQKINLMDYQQGYYLKELEDHQLVLIIRYFRKSGKLWQTKWLFKI